MGIAEFILDRMGAAEPEPKFSHHYDDGPLHANPIGATIQPTSNLSTTQSKLMTPEQIAKRLAELQELAKQHEAILLQISGAIQEYNRVLADMSQAKGKEAENAADQKPQQESV